MIIPIGIDCGAADFLKKNNLRTCALPFDWVVTYHGISNIIRNDFNNYIPVNSDRLNTDYQVSFVHFTFPEDTEKIQRRVERFKTILETSIDSIYFLRKGHAFHNHSENSIKNDIEDAEELDSILAIKYPNLKYEIIVVLMCGSCFDSTKEYISKSTKVKVYNRSTPIVNDKLFIDVCADIFSSR